MTGSLGHASGSPLRMSSATGNTTAAVIWFADPDELSELRSNSLDPERVADFYATDLLFPRYLFVPRAVALRLSTFEAVEILSREYSTSIPATAIRLAQYGPEPAMLVCHGPEGRKWFNRPQQIPERWFLRDDLSADSFAMNVLYGKNRFGRRSTVGAEAWFDRWDASRYELYEQSFKISDQEVLALLVLLTLKCLKTLVFEPLFSYFPPRKPRRK
jgi:hypothetical protein